MVGTQLRQGGWNGIRIRNPDEEEKRDQTRKKLYMYNKDLKKINSKSIVKPAKSLNG